MVATDVRLQLLLRPGALPRLLRDRVENDRATGQPLDPQLAVVVLASFRGCRAPGRRVLIRSAARCASWWSRPAVSVTGERPAASFTG
ncbi:hypothetical protein [Amycolatopsis sp. 195334CR]|uniref:hypothetical protein n=1 Tax=Amycolatopsis sp. 195334CR TaxID=2814588 RepID=UPI001A8E5FEF|nr:hypothetical protein [Amycolatopsis sp. 195334CR]MBN6039993.1 hypothetical protein [Amycolatopsis sp. 195334CR]